MQLDYHIYELRSLRPLGARSCGVVRTGALLRARWEGSEAGYADLHPWPELGDEPLTGQLARLAAGETTDLSLSSLAFAALDARSRTAGRSLWAGLTVPESHLLLADASGDAEASLAAGLAEGFTRFKVKLGADLDAERQTLLRLAAFLAKAPQTDGEPPKLRLDYNESPSPARFVEYFTGLKDVSPTIDFIEDPFPFHAAAWAEAADRLGIRLALDRAATHETAEGFGGVIIRKPARTGPSAPPALPGRRLIVTSYLDHPLGQLCAAWVAAGLPAAERNERHGLLSHRAYERTRFSDRLGWSGPRLTPPEGHGFGFDDELAGLDWKELR